MKKTVHEAVTAYLKELNWWMKPHELIEALYPHYEKMYSKDSFKRLVFRALKKDTKIMKNFHGPYYAYMHAFRRPITRSEIEFIQQFFFMVDHPEKFYHPDLEESKQYPNIQLKRTVAFRRLHSILSRLWEDPRDVEIISAEPKSRKKKRR